MKGLADRFVPGAERLLSSLAYLCGRLLLLVVTVQFAIVLARYLFAANYLWLQELVIYLHASIFMFAAAWGLACNKHVRIDVIWGRLSTPGKRRIEWFGTGLLLLPMMATIFVTSLPYVQQSWLIAEGSPEVSGLPGLFLLKTLLPVFAILMVLAGLTCLSRLKQR
ncbi:MAG: TRAP transporter small permease subunit [Rhizobiaceae bacterium]|nr:TRAP transporter small permease subunit [Rhizobiaceae bacterium]